MNLAKPLDVSAAGSAILFSTYIQRDGCVFTKHDIFQENAERKVGCRDAGILQHSAISVS
jgi:hypothetical protein